MRTSPTNLRWGDRLERAMMLRRLMQELCETRNVDRHTPARESLLDLLKQPTISVWIAERKKRSIAAMLGIFTVDSPSPKQIGFVRASVHAARVVEQLACVDAVGNDLVARNLDVGDDQIQSLG